jgi:predicted ATPase
MEIPFVGREKEFSQFQQILQRTKNTRSGTAILITGQMGVGKTRFIQEISREAEKMEYSIMLGRCLDEKAIPFLPVIEAFEKFSTNREETAKYVPIGLVAGAKEEDTALIEITRERIRMMETLMGRFSKITEKSSVLFILDDMQWADTGTLGLFNYLARNIKTLNLILVGIYPDDYVKTRGSPQFQEFLTNLIQEKNVNTLYLHPLKLEDVSKIGGVILGTWKLPDNLVEVIYEKTEGNPLFVEEVAKAIKEQGLFDLNTRKLTVPLEAITIPSSVRSVIAMRLKELNENETKVMGCASVIGRVFDYEILKQIVDMSDEELLDIIEHLVDRRFFEEMPGDTESFRFMHNPVYEVVYSDLSGLRKKVLHKKAGEVLEKMYSADLRYHAEIGRHYLTAGVSDKAAEYLVSAAEYALKNFACKESITYCEGAQSALANIKNPDLKDKLQQKIYRITGECHIIHGDLRSALSAFERAYACAKKEKEKAEILIKLSGIYQETGETEKAFDVLVNAKALMEKENDREGIASAMTRLAALSMHTGAFSKARELFEKAIEICREIGNEKMLSDAYHGMGTLFIDIGETKNAEEYLNKALEIRKKLSMKKGLASTYNNLAIVAQDLGDINKALEYYEMAKKIYDELGDLLGIATINNNLAIIHVPRGETDKAMELYLKNVEISERTGDVTTLMLAYRNIAWVYRFKEEYKKALEFYEKSLAISRRIDEKTNLASVLNRMAITYANLGDFDKAFEYAWESLKIAESTNNLDLIADAKWGIGEVYHLNKDYANAEKYLLETRKIYENAGKLSYISEVDDDLGRVYSAMGRVEDAKRCLNNALEFYKKVGALALIKEVEKELAKVEGKNENIADKDRKE